MNVPLVDLKANSAPLKTEILGRVSQIIDNCNFILGEEVLDFEKKFSRYCHSKYGIGVANGTEAIHLALRAAGINEGDEVILPANTFIATALGVSYAGAVPKLIDVDPKTFLMDLDKIKTAITPRTKAIIPVHLYGRMCNMDTITALAKEHNLLVIEDAAQAHGAELGGLRAGSTGMAGCFSFYPGKNLGAFGDGGLITTNSKDVYESLLALRNYGSPRKYYHPVKGYNCRLDTIQAAVLLTKLPHLDEYNRNRYKLACRYNVALDGVGDLVLPQIPEAGSHVFHLYVVRTGRRDELLAYLNQEGIGAGIHYPTPVHMHGAFHDLGYQVGDFPCAETMADEILSLPIYPELTDEQLAYVVAKVKDFFQG